MPKGKPANARGGSWVFRDIPREVMRQAKIIAAVQGTSVKQLLIGLLRKHGEDLERKGVLPKGKG